MIRSTPKIVTPEKALIRLEELCVKAERCESEARTKLRTWKISADDTEDIINSLIRRRFIDDARYASAFVRDRYRFARWGRRRIVLELRRKRIASEHIEEALDEIVEDEYIDILEHLIKAKSARMERPLNYDDRAALYRFAAGRGYEPDLISRILKKVASAEEE